VIRDTALTYIRTYSDPDAEKIARMWRESAAAWPGGGPSGGEYSTARHVIEEQRDLNTLATLVAYLPDPETGEERAVGYLSLFEYTGEIDTAYVGILSAHPAWHGKGVGRDLLRLALDRTVQLGYSRLDLNTWAGNLKAVPLYKKSGYFWVPDTTVKMENYLPLIFRLPAAQRFFKTADWYADLQRDLSVGPDDERRGSAQVYTYRWVRDDRQLTVVIDRRAKGVAAIETDGYAVSLDVDDPRLPVGGQRNATWRLENRGARPMAVSLLSEGEDAVRCTTQRTARSSAPMPGAHRPAPSSPAAGFPPIARPTASSQRSSSTARRSHSWPACR
jgi:RimJ/RimL family protein N-acetyltransferase